MSELAIPLSGIPALIERERMSLAEITEPAAMADAERRAAAIADLVKRAGLAVPIQNEATFLRAEALERLAVLVDAAQSNGEVRRQGRQAKGPKSGPLPAPKQRIAEGRAIAGTGVISKARTEAGKHPDKPVSMDAILKQAKRSQREKRLHADNKAKEQEARDAGNTYDLVTADLRAWRPTCDSIITDPPYIGDSIPLYEALRDFAVDVLPEGAALVVMTWQGILPAVIRALEHEQLAYRWTICWRFDNNERTPDHTRRVFDCWKPILVYHKGEMPSDVGMIRDEITNSAPDKQHHAWGQTVSGFERLVKTFSQPGQIVCDPFLGGGTTAIAALAQARNFVGCDIDSEAVEITRRRLALEPSEA